jgi:Kdo2-lipid IVA lauroyltransferase/acyltransferase
VVNRTGYTKPLALHALRLLPLRWARGLGRALGWLLWLLRTRPARISARNIALCLPSLTTREGNRLARRSMQESAAVLAELGLAWCSDAARIRRHVQIVDGLEVLQRARASGKGVLLLMPHLGNWELLVCCLSWYVPVTVMYKPLRSQRLDRTALAARSRFGTRMVPANRSGVAQLLRELRAGAVAGVLPDQQPDRVGGLFADFFGIPALTPTLPHGLMARTDCVVLTAWCERVPQGFALRFAATDPDLPRHDAEDCTGAMNRALEELVRSVPAQYQWEYTRFSKRPPASPRLY